MPRLPQEFWQSPVSSAAKITASLIVPRMRPGWRPVAKVGGSAISFRVHADLTTPLGLKLYRYGHWDDDLELVVSRLRPGDTFVDGGANVGLFTLAAAHAVGPSGKVISFEPAPSTADALEANIALNRLRQVTVSRAALAGSQGATTFVAFEGAKHGFSSFAPADLRGGRALPVATTTLDASVDRENLRLVKLDLEGAEAVALEGALDTLEHARPEFLIEVEDEHLRRQGSTAAALFDLFADYRYRPRSFGTGCRVPNVWFVPEP